MAELNQRIGKMAAWERRVSEDYDACKLELAAVVRQLEVANAWHVAPRCATTAARCSTLRQLAVATALRRQRCGALQRVARCNTAQLVAARCTTLQLHQLVATTCLVLQQVRDRQIRELSGQVRHSTRTRARAHTHTHTCARMHTHMCAHAHARTHARTHMGQMDAMQESNRRTRELMTLQSQKEARVHARAHTYTRTHARTHTHTHRRTHSTWPSPAAGRWHPNPW